ncbi:hypothetical protein ACHAWF_003555, partial [Thalassiosira exigua]
SPSSSAGQSSPRRPARCPSCLLDLWSGDGGGDDDRPLPSPTSDVGGGGVPARHLCDTCASLRRRRRIERALGCWDALPPPASDIVFVNLEDEGAARGKKRRRGEDVPTVPAAAEDKSKAKDRNKKEDCKPTTRAEHAPLGERSLIGATARVRMGRHAGLTGKVVDRRRVCRVAINGVPDATYATHDVVVVRAASGKGNNNSNNSISNDGNDTSESSYLGALVRIVRPGDPRHGREGTVSHVKSGDWYVTDNPNIDSAYRAERFEVISYPEDKGDDSVDATGDVGVKASDDAQSSGKSDAGDSSNKTGDQARSLAETEPVKSDDVYVGAPSVSTNSTDKGVAESELAAKLATQLPSVEAIELSSRLSAFDSFLFLAGDERNAEGNGGSMEDCLETSSKTPGLTTEALATESSSATPSDRRDKLLDELIQERQDARLRPAVARRPHPTVERIVRLVPGSREEWHEMQERLGAAFGDYMFLA